MTSTIFWQTYGGILTSLVTDLVAITYLSGFLYFRRHWRADLLLAYGALNVGIFVTMALLTQVKVDIAVGFGLFAILSIVRLSSSRVTQQEVAYYFLSLVLGLVNGLGVPDRVLAIGMNIVLLLVMTALDRRKVRDRAERLDVKIEGVYTGRPGLQNEIERRLGREVGYYEITEIDLIHNHMLIDVRLRPGDGVTVPPHEKHKENHKENHKGEHHDHAGAPETTQVMAAPVAPGGPHPHPQPRPYPHPDGTARHGM